MTKTTLKNCLYPWRICTPSNTWFRGPTRVFIQNGMSIGSAVFAQRTVECPINLQWAAIFSPRAHPSHLAKRHLDRFSRFRMGFKCYALSMGENPKIAHWALPFGIASPAGEGPSHGHRQQAQKVVKIARVVREICSRTDRQTDRQTDTQTQTCSLQ